MAPAITGSEDSLLNKRLTCDYYYYGNCYSSWTWYGRWVFAGIVVFVVLLIFIIWACVNSRRRRRRGVAPLYGTGWMAPAPGNQYNNPHAYNQAPPAYGAPQSYPMQNQYTGNTFQSGDGYYGQQTGVQQPKNVYGGPQNVGTEYAPPEGPPPNKVVR